MLILFICCICWILLYIVMIWCWVFGILKISIFGSRVMRIIGCMVLDGIMSGMSGVMVNGCLFVVGLSVCE